METREDYKGAKRTGRGIRLSRAERKAIWPVFEEYRNLLEKHHLREPEDIKGCHSSLGARRSAVKIRSILVDEAQDMSTHAFAFLRAVIPEEQPNDIFIVGDGHQRIYRKRVVLSRAGLNIRGRSRRLRINYRTTDEIRRFAVALLEGVEFDDLDAGVDTTSGYRSLTSGENPELACMTRLRVRLQPLRIGFRERLNYSGSVLSQEPKPKWSVTQQLLKIGASRFVVSVQMRQMMFQSLGYGLRRCIV